MDDPNRAEREIQHHIDEELIIQKTLCTLKYSQWDQRRYISLNGQTQNLLKAYVIYYIDLLRQENIQNIEELKKKLFEFELILNDIFHELKKIIFIEKRQHVVYKVRNLKKRLYAVTTSDTDTDYTGKLARDANHLLNTLEEDKDHLRFPDLFKELKELIELISTAGQNANNHLYIEAASGTLVLFSSSVAGVVGAIAGRLTSTAARGGAISLSAVGDALYAGRYVAAAANIAIETVNVGSTILDAFPITVRGYETRTSVNRSSSINEQIELLNSRIRYMVNSEDVSEIALRIFNEMIMDDIERFPQ